ncbi:MAG: PQQ-dependent sugar dehydrogenase [Mycobacteriales bacterium]
MIWLLLLGLLINGCSRNDKPAVRATATPAASATASASASVPSATASPSASAPSASAVSSAPPSVAAGPLTDGPPKLEPVGSFKSPMYLTAPIGDKRLFIVEQAGVVRVVDSGKVAREPFLDISKDVKSGGEQGLLSIAFSPDYANDGHVYVYYTDNDGHSRVVEFTRDTGGDRVDPESRRELLKVDQPYSNHNGGLLLFDSSKMLLIGLGDGGSGGDPEDRGQNMKAHLGKLLRIDPRPAGERPYGIPADNPFVGRDSARPEIWAYGVRNPWRFSFGPDGTFFLADVGQNVAEEIKVVTPEVARGANYGWAVFEGDQQFKDRELTPGGALVEPSLVYGHDEGRCSVTGGGVYGGSVVALRGKYLYGDYCSGEVWAATVTGTKLSDPQLVFTVPSISSFGVDDASEMYVMSTEGAVQRITA